MNDHIDDFQNWCDLWEKANKKGMFSNDQKTTNDVKIEDGFYDEDSAIDQYYSNIDRMISEEKQSEKNFTKSTNPIRPDTIGKDQDYPVASWQDEESLNKLKDLKAKLYDLECKLAETDAGGKKWVEGSKKVNDKKIWKKLHDLKNQIDKMSDQYGLDDEPDGSMWHVKK